MSAPSTGFGNNANVSTGNTPASGGIEIITASRELIATDKGKIFDNRGASNIVLTWPAGITDAEFNVAGKQSSTGTIQIAAGAGVAMVGNANVTALQGQYVYASYSSADTFDVKVG
jgi:hypothetical protein